MFRQNYMSHCKAGCCKQDNTQWKNCIGYKNYTKDQRNQNFLSGPSKGFVQNLKDKIVNLQNESVNLQFVKKPVKKKQKDYYCLMLRKINNLDKKLQNLEDLFITHLNHTPNEVLNSNDNEPLYDYMDFYESVRSLVNLANTLKEDLLYKQCDNHMSNRNSLHINDRIQVLDSELRHLYTYLEQLQNYTNEINDPKNLFLQERYWDQPYSYSIYEENLSNNRKPGNFNEIRNLPKNKRKPPKTYNREYKNQYLGSYDADEDSPISCQCSRCNLHAKLHSINSHRRYSPKRFEYCQGRPFINNSDCSCVNCVNEGKQEVKLTNNSIWVPQSFSSCSCDLCISNNQKCTNTKCNSARIQIVKPPQKSVNDENVLDELQISYHQLKPNQTGKKKKQKNNKSKLNSKEEEQNINSETADSSPERPLSSTASKIKAGDTTIFKENKKKLSVSQNFKGFEPRVQNQEMVEGKVVYYEVTPELNIITKRKNNIQVYNNGQEYFQGGNKHAKKNRKNTSNTKADISRNAPFRIHTVNYHNTKHPPYKDFKKSVKNPRKSYDYDIIDTSSSDNNDLDIVPQQNDFDKKYLNEQKDKNKNTGTMGKHLHITFHKEKDYEKLLTDKQKVKRSIDPQNKYTNGHSQLYYKRQDNFLNFRNTKYGKKTFPHKRFRLSYPCHAEISESDSFETVEENGSDSDSRSSQCKLFVCNDPDCIEKLDSDELIMLMNKIDSTSCNPCSLDISQSVKDFKSDGCEKCTITEKTISITPHKLKNNDNGGKSKIIIKKEFISCSNCKNKNNDCVIPRTTKTNSNYGAEKNIKTLGEIEKIASNIDKNKRKNTISVQEDILNSIELEPSGKISKSNTKYNENVSGNKNRKEINKQEINQTPDKKLYSSSYAGSAHKSNNNLNHKDKSKFATVAHTNLDQNCSLNMLKENENHSSKGLELAGFGNTININIERGPYTLNQQSDQLYNQNNTGKEIDSSKTNLDSLGKTNKSPRLKSQARETKIENETNSMLYRSYLTDKNNNLPLKSHDIGDVQRNKSSQTTKQNFNFATNKSSSVLDLATDKNVKEATTVKSEIFTKAGKTNNSRIQKEEGTKGYYKKDTNIQVYAANIIHKTDGQTFQSKEKMNTKSDISLNYELIKKQENLLLHSKGSKNAYGKENEPTQHKKYKVQYLSKKNTFEPKLSISRLKRNRLKYNKNFAPSLSKVSNINSIVLQQAKLYPGDDLPSKKLSVFNPGRRINKLSKQRHSNLYRYPRLPSVKENSLSGIMKPQVEILVRESYQNDLKTPSNDSSNMRYKLASVSNYLSSTVTSETSYSTLNWEKVAKKLKEDDNYFNDIA